MEVCRICLATDTKMLLFDKKRVLFYEHITGLEFVYDDLLPKYACWECQHYMSKYVAFKIRAQKSHCALTEILNRDGLITKSSVENCNRYKSSLTKTDILYLILKEEEVNKELEIKIKDESNDNIIDNFVEINYDTTNNFEDESLSNDDDALISDLIVSTTPITENTDSIKENNDSTNNSEDKSLSNDDALISDLIVSTTSITENTDSIKENNDSTNNSEDEHLSNDDALLSDMIVSTPIIENTDSLKENNVIKQSQAKLPSAKRKRKEEASEISKVAKNSNDKDKSKKPNKSLKLVRGRRKKASTVKEKEDGKSSTKELDKNILLLTKLTMDEQIADIQKRKESDNYRNSRYKCEICFKGFVDVNAFNRHLAKHSEASGGSVCPLCKMRYAKPGMLNNHMNSHLYRITCLQCNFSTNTMCAARKHQSFHQGAIYVCPHCKEVYTHHTSLLNHLRIKHPSDIVCQHCGCSFVNEHGLKKHEKWVHRAEQKEIPADGPVCARCDIRFSCQEALERHRQVSDKHADERTAGIVKPGRNTYPVTKERNKPGWTSDLFSDGSRACEECEEKLPNPRAYYNHFRTAHKDKHIAFLYNNSEQKHMCEVCGKLFKSNAQLRSHSYAHSSTKQFKCDRCGKLFQLEIYLFNHKRDHCGTRAGYPCRVCGKVFASVSNRGRHMAIHKGLKFKCELCDKVFRCPSNKKAHVDFVHKKKPWPKRNRGSRRRPDRQPKTVAQNPSNETESDMDEESNTP